MKCTKAFILALCLVLGFGGSFTCHSGSDNHDDQHHHDHSNGQP